MSITGSILELTNKELAKEINCSDRQVRYALKSLEERGIIAYDRGKGYGKNTDPTKSIVMVH
jgi:MarR-like DNA-binding transcriptional regulator SgrR of sgrS sRNA